MKHNWWQEPKCWAGRRNRDAQAQEPDDFKCKRKGQTLIADRYSEAFNLRSDHEIVTSASSQDTGQCAFSNCWQNTALHTRFLASPLTHVTEGLAWDQNCTCDFKPPWKAGILHDMTFNWGKQDTWRHCHCWQVTGIVDHTLPWTKIPKFSLWCFGVRPAP